MKEKYYKCLQLSKFFVAPGLQCQVLLTVRQADLRAEARVCATSDSKSGRLFKRWSPKFTQACKHMGRRGLFVFLFFPNLRFIVHERI